MEQIAMNAAAQEAATRANTLKKDLGKMPKPWLAMRIVNPIVAVGD